MQGSEATAYKVDNSADQINKTPIYLVYVDDNNDEGDTWTVEYLDQTLKTDDNKCDIKSVRKISDELWKKSKQ